MNEASDSNLQSQGMCKAQDLLPKYKCHKEVWAAKITEITQAPADQECMNAGGDWYLHLEGGSRVIVGHNKYYTKHLPEVGGYFVVYKDDYQSFSPADVFEDGYTLA
jgi:hypothetical protein